MANLIYQHPSDQLLSDDVTITPSTEDATYPKAGLYDNNPAKAFKMTATTGNIVFDFGSPVNIDIFAIIHHNLTAGLSNVKFQGNATDSWGSPSLDQTVTIPTYEEDGFPVNPWLDLSALSNSFQFWRLNFGTANAANIALGQIWLGGTKRSLVRNFEWGFQEMVDRKIIEHVTDYDVSTIYDLGAKIKGFTLTLKTTVAGMLAVEQWWDSCRGRSLPTLIILDPAVKDARMVRWLDPVRTIERKWLGVNIIQLKLREVSRGLVF